MFDGVFFKGADVPDDADQIDLHSSAVRLSLSNGGNCGATWVTENCLVTSGGCVSESTTGTIT